MRKYQLSLERTRNDAFLVHGRDNVVLIEVFPVRDREMLKLTFESVASTWRQGVWLRTDKGIMVEGELCPSVELWYDTAPREVPLECRTRNGCLHLYNKWDDGNGPESLAWSSGMLVEAIRNGRRYRCNDYGFETNFSKLVFTLERVPS